MDRRAFLYSALELASLKAVSVVHPKAGASPEDFRGDEGAIRRHIEKLALGGTVYISAGVIRLSEDLYIPDGVNLWGQGSGWSGKGTVFIGATIRFGERGVRNTGGVSGNFSIVEGRLYLGRVLQRTFLNIDVIRARGDAILIEESQNALFQQVNATEAEGNGLVLSCGAGGLLFQKCEINASRNFGVIFSADEVGTGLLYKYPSHIKFDHCLIERNGSGAVRHSGGIDNTFDTSVLAEPTAGVVVDVEAAIRLRFRDSSVIGNATACGLRVRRGATVVREGVNRYNNLREIEQVEKGGTIADLGRIEASAIRDRSEMPSHLR